MSAAERSDRQRQADAAGRSGRIVDLGAVLASHMEQFEARRGKPSPLDALIPPRAESEANGA